MLKVTRYQHAVLVDKFKLKPWEIARLSERYIHEVYFHPRDEHGSLVPPVKPLTAADFGTRYNPPASLEDELESLRTLHKQLIGTDKRGKGITNIRDAEKKIRAKWADGSRLAAYNKWKAESGKRLADS